MSLIMIAVDVAAGQIPFVTVHTKELILLLKAVTGETLFEVVVIVAVPLSTDQLPVPIVGEIAAKVAMEEQTV